MQYYFWHRGYKKASMTVEASLVLPIFLFAALSILSFNKLILYEEQVQWALARVAREASVEYAAMDKSFVISPAYLTGKMNLYLKGDELSVSMMRSKFEPETDEMDLIADFEVEAPFPIVFKRNFHFTEQIHTRAFTGVKTRRDGADGDKDTVVYVTKTGNVYHRSLSCTYLKLHISQVRYGELAHLRSESGGKYYECGSCCQGVSFGAGDNVFICSYGDRFHSCRTCRNLKRSIREVPLSEAAGRLPCSKCGKE